LVTVGLNLRTFHTKTYVHYDSFPLPVFTIDVCGVLCKVRTEAEEITDDLNVINKHHRVLITSNVYWTVHHCNS